MPNPHAWFLDDLKRVRPNGLTVMSTFACGGGSSMGYKRAGYRLVAANDIDPEMAWHYKRNLDPPRYFLCPIRDLLAADLPDELFDLDVLDGSPPCSTFSMAGSREGAWGKDKHFREGQAKQVLSDLFFDFLDLVERLRPRVVIAENVKGMILGNAKGYVKLIFQQLRSIGYRPQLFLVNSADCGVPQRRERTFFCAMREDLSAPPLRLVPKQTWVSASAACRDIAILTPTQIEETRPSKEALSFWARTTPGKSFAVTKKQLGLKGTGFCRIRLSHDLPSNTLTSLAGDFYHWGQCRVLTFEEWKRLGSFPDDYHAKTNRIGKYMIGMSVPPKMTEYVARQVAEQWFGQSTLAG